MGKAASVATVADEQLVTMRIHHQLLGIPVREVRDILRGQPITRIPLVSREIAGALNLRGRVVTVIDIRHRLGLPEREASLPFTFVVVERKSELYALTVDSVGDVLTLSNADICEAPPNLSDNWRNLSSGIYRLENELLVLVDPAALFNFA